MKHYYLTALAIIACATSCIEGNYPTKAGKEIIEESSTCKVTISATAGTRNITDDTPSEFRFVLADMSNNIVATTTTYSNYASFDCKPGQYQAIACAVTGTSYGKEIDAKGTRFWEGAGDIFWAKQDVSVASSKRAEVNLILKRQCAKLTIESNDTVEPIGTSCEIKVGDYNLYNYFDLITGDVDIDPMSYNYFAIGDDFLDSDLTMGVSLYTLVPQDGYCGDIEIKVMWCGEVVRTVTIPNVTLKRNHNTIIRGNLFGDGADITFDYDFSWAEDIEVNL